MAIRSINRLILLFVCIGLVMWMAGRSQSQPAAQTPRCEISFPLPNASDIGPTKFEKLLYSFLEKSCYKTWIADNQIRNSGPFINGQSFGTHNAVKIF